MGFFFCFSGRLEKLYFDRLDAGWFSFYGYDLTTFYDWKGDSLGAG